MIAYLPLPGGHIKLAERFVNPALSFAMVSRLVRTMSPSLKISTTGMELLYVATSLMRWHDQFGSPYLSIYQGYNWTILLPAELSAASVLMKFWTTEVNSAVWVTMCFVVVLIINLFGAGVYGECEFIFAYVLPIM